MNTAFPVSIKKIIRASTASLLLILATAFLPSSVATPSNANEGGHIFDSFPWISASWDDSGILLRFENIRPGTYELYELDVPARIVLDIPNLTCAGNEVIHESYDFASPNILTQLRVTCSGEMTRIVLESKHQLYWEITSTEDQDDLNILVLTRFRQTIEEISLDPGTSYIARRYVTPVGQRFVHVVVTDSSLSRLRPRVVMSSDVMPRSLGSINTIVNGCGATVGINGGFFMWPGISLSLVVQNGEITSPPQLHRPALMVLENGRYIIDYPSVRGLIMSASGVQLEADVVNETPGTGQIALLTPGHPSRIRDEIEGQTAVITNSVVEAVSYGDIEDFTDRYILWSRRYSPALGMLDVGEEVQIDLVIDGLVPVMHAMQGGPFLLRNGAIYMTSEADDFGRDIANGRSARTAVGIDNQNRIYFVVVEGPASDRSMGSTLNELAWTMLDLGATWAINMDGGSSSGMALGFHDPDTELPSGGRSIATALVLIDETGQMQGQQFHF